MRERMEEELTVSVFYLLSTPLDVKPLIIGAGLMLA